MPSKPVSPSRRDFLRQSLVAVPAVGLMGASAIELRRKALEEGMITLRMSGLLKVKAGLTSIEECVRETVK